MTFTRVVSRCRAEVDRVLAHRDRVAVSLRTVPDPKRPPLGGRHVVGQRHVEPAPRAAAGRGQRRPIDQYGAVAIEQGDPELRFGDVGETR